MDIIYTVLWAFVPFLELRFSIPFAYLTLGLPIHQAIIASVLGVIIITSLVLRLLPIMVTWIAQISPYCHRWIERIFRRTRKEHSHNMRVLGEIFLIFFIAVPLPGSGAWTGALICYLFGLKYGRSLCLIGIGVLISGIIVGLLTIFGHELWQMLIDNPAEVVEPLLPS